MTDSNETMSTVPTAVSEYIPGREALLVQVDLGEYLIDYYLHRKDHAPDTLPEHDTKLKELIACFAVHLCARTPLETHAWTVHIVSDRPYSLFVTGSTGEMEEGALARGFIVGHVLTEHIRHTDVNSIHTQFSYRGKSYQSLVRCDSSDIPRMVEQFYAQSEQHLLRLKISDSDDTVIGLVALPESDDEWIRGAKLETLPTSDEIERHPMRSCVFAFLCECSAEKLLPFFRTLSRDALLDLYGEDDEIEITCPRCGKQFSISRSELGLTEDA